jgi:hypothetical protein
VVQLSDDILQSIKVKAKPILAFTEIWNSKGTQSESQVSIWSPSLQISMLSSSSKARVCLGYYAIKGFNSPLKSKTSGQGYQTLEVTDFATIRMKRGRVMNSVMMTFFPHPLRYKQLWHLSRAGKVLYAWKPVAPDGFTALGIICTVTGKLMRWLP